MFRKNRAARSGEGHSSKGHHCLQANKTNTRRGHNRGVRCLKQEATSPGTRTESSAPPLLRARLPTKEDWTSRSVPSIAVMAPPSPAQARIRNGGQRASAARQGRQLHHKLPGGQTEASCSVSPRLCADRQGSSSNTARIGSRQTDKELGRLVPPRSAPLFSNSERYTRTVADAAPSAEPSLQRQQERRYRSDFVRVETPPFSLRHAITVAKRAGTRWALTARQANRG